MARVYKIRSFQNGKNSKGKPFINFSLTLPTPLAEKLIKDLGGHIKVSRNGKVDVTTDFGFEIELTKDGILYKPVAAEDSVPDSLPFKTQKASGNGRQAPAKPKPAAKAKPAAKKTATKPAAKKTSTPRKPATGKARPAAKPSRPAKASGAPKRPSRPARSAA